MDQDKLKLANKLNSDIRALEQALDCFEWQPEGSEEPLSLNPILWIQYDDCDDCRTHHEIPMDLNNELIFLLKQEIMKSLELKRSKFEQL
jgi:hypothetical protein